MSLGRFYDEVLETPGERVIGLLVVMLVVSVFGMIPYLEWIGGLLMVHYLWWWWVTVRKIEAEEPVVKCRGKRGCK